MHGPVQAALKKAAITYRIGTKSVLDLINLYNTEHLNLEPCQAVSRLLPRPPACTNASPYKRPPAPTQALTSVLANCFPDVGSDVESH